MTDQVQVTDHGVGFVGPKAVNLYRMQTILQGLKMEQRGMRLTRGPKCSTIVRREYGLKGKHPALIEQFEQLLAEAKAQVPIVDERTSP